MEEFAPRAGHEVLIEVVDNTLQIVGNPQGIFDFQLRTRTVPLLNIIVILINCTKLHHIKSYNYSKN
jgi:hypothetical protein